MVRYANSLEPGDVIFIHGQRAIVEMVQCRGGACTIRHSLGTRHCDGYAKFLVEDDEDYVREAEQIVSR